MRKSVYLAHCTVLALVLTTACADGNSPPTISPSLEADRQFPNWPATLNEFRFHWTAEPTIDLTTGPAIPIRAYLEAYDVASYSRDLANLYPGFLRATPPNDELDGHYIAQLAWIRPFNGREVKPEDALDHFGYKPFHLLRIDRIGNGHRAIVCEGDFANFVPSETHPDKFIYVGADPRTAQLPPATTGVHVIRLEFTENDPRVGTTPPPAVTAPQRGPDPAPNQDVFGNWFFTGVSSSIWGRIDSADREILPSPELERQCSERLPYTETERVAMMTGFKDRPPPHGQAEPGWPVKPN